MTIEEFQSACGRLLHELHESVPAAWGLSREALAAACWKSAAKAGVDKQQVAAFLGGLRVRDLALAAACAEGSEAAWTVFFEEQRGPLRAAGRAMAGDRGEELASALFGELYEARQAKLGSYGGRSTLAGWLRAVLYQAYVDRLRSEKRFVALEDPPRAGGEESAPPPELPARPAPDLAEQSQYAGMARSALDRALAALPPRQKLLLDFYYFHGLTLREAAALVKVHEATASRELERARGSLKKLLTEILRKDYRLGEREVRECLYTAVEAGWEWGARQAVSKRS